MRALRLCLPIPGQLISITARPRVKWEDRNAQELEGIPPTLWILEPGVHNLLPVWAGQELICTCGGRSTEGWAMIHCGLANGPLKVG